MLGCCVLAVAVAAAELDETADSALWLLKKASLVHRDGRHNILLRALRQLKDPALEPFFTQLVQKHHPVLKIHGVLGLAEISSNQRIDLALLADLKDPLTQAQLVSSALEADLLDADQCKQLLQWPDLDAAVKTIVVGKLMADGKLQDLSILDKAQASQKLAMKGMLALLHLQQGQQAAAAVLDEVHQSSDPTRESVEAMLLQTALRLKFQSAASWALRIAQSTGEDKNVTYLALRVAMQFNAPQAADVWSKHFQAAAPADRIRLALLALDLAQSLPPKLFDPLLKDEEELVRHVGQTGKAIASKQPAENQILKLLELNHLLASQWVLQYAQRVPIDQAKPLLVGMILAAENEPNPARFRGQRIENSVFATEDLLKRDTSSGPVVNGLISQSPALTQEAMLMGLIRASGQSPQKIIEGVATWKSETAEALALLLRARHEVKLSDQDRSRLSLLVRGGAGLQEPLRLQAAWLYLKLTQQDKVALASLNEP